MRYARYITMMVNTSLFRPCSMQVMQTMRAGITCQGKSAVGICLEHIKHIIPDTPTVVRECIKVAGLRKHNQAKDFVPLNSTDTVIKRGSKNQSRKCTIVWLEILPSTLRENLMEGKIYFYFLM